MAMASGASINSKRAAQPVSVITHVTTGELKLRKGSGTAYAVLRILPAASEVTLLGRSGSWASIQCGLLIGWIPGHCLRLAPAKAELADAAHGQDSEIPSIAGPQPTHATTAILNVRKGAGTKYAVLRVLDKGSRVAVVEHQGTWTRIDAGIATGWVSSAYLIPLKLRLPIRGIVALPPEAHRTTIRLNVRKDAGDHYPTLQLLPKGARVTVTGSLNGWKRVETDRGYGWIPATQLEPVADASAQPVTTWNTILRTGSAESFRSILEITAGSVVTVLGTRAGWVKVGFDGHTGWIPARSLE